MKYLMTIALLVFSISSFSQKIKLLGGSLEPLRDQSSINFKFLYDSMVVGKERVKEPEYVKMKIEKLNKQETGLGDRWQKAWVNNRQQKFEPKFIQLFEKYSNLESNVESKYTLIFHTLRIEPGWAGFEFIRKSARVDAAVYIVETANPANIIAKLSVKNAPGQGLLWFDYITDFRIQEAYAKAGKEMGKLIQEKDLSHN